MTKSRLLKTMTFCAFGLTLFSRASMAGCFTGPQLVEDDAYKGYQFTNNCADPATVYWRRSYKKQDGSQGSESGSWYVSKCSTETKQYFQGDYTFGSIDVDESKICIGKDVKRPDTQPNAASNGSPPTSKPSGTALAKAAADAKQKAEEARAKARQAAEKAEQARSAAEDEKKRLKAQAQKLPSWCPGMVSACEERAASIANASQETQSQCRAYCQILTIENCNGASSTVQQAAQACNSGAQRDQRAETERERAAKEQQIRRDAEERLKWHCFGEAGNVRQGFDECQSACRAYFSATHCHSVCYASGDGSIANGRSCYREP